MCALLWQNVCVNQNNLSY